MTSEVTQTAGVAREGPSVRPLQLCVCRLCECLQHFLGWCGWREQGFGLTLSHKLSPHAHTHSKAESGGRGFTERLPLQSTAQGPTPHQLPRLRLPDPDDRTERESAKRPAAPVSSSHKGFMLLLLLWQQQTRSRRKHKDESFPLFLFLATFI